MKRDLEARNELEGDGCSPGRKHQAEKPVRPVSGCSVGQKKKGRKVKKKRCGKCSSVQVVGGRKVFAKKK